MGSKPGFSVLTFLLILIFFNTSISLPQSPDAPLYRVELKDGTVVVGHILSDDETTLYFRTLSNIEISIRKNLIVKLDRLEGQMVEGTFWPSDPNQTRLLFSPTGRALKKGQGYFAIYEIFFPFLAYGISDWLTLAGGFTLIPGAESQLLYLAPKVTPLRRPNYDISAGILLIKIPEEEDLAGILYGVGSYGTEKASLTLGLGFAYGGGDIADKPVFVLGGELRTSKSLKLISENWLIPDSDVQLVSAGLRFFGEKIAADFALFYPLGADTEGWPFFPWVGFAYNFGKKK